MGNVWVEEKDEVNLLAACAPSIVLQVGSGTSDYVEHGEPAAIAPVKVLASLYVIAEDHPRPVLAAAILDRLLHHSHTILVQGDSYRLKQKRKAGLMPKATK